MYVNSVNSSVLKLFHSSVFTVIALNPRHDTMFDDEFYVCVSGGCFLFPEHDEMETRDETWNEQLKFHTKLSKCMLGKHDNINSIDLLLILVLGL